jgi:hypothetical protein
MSDLYEMFKSEEMLANWEAFFQNEGHDTEELAIPKW